VEDLVGIFRQRDPLELPLPGIVEQAKLDLGGIGRKQREIDAEPGPGGAQRIGKTFPETTSDIRHGMHSR
jgi:hypothetical protein